MEEGDGRVRDRGGGVEERDGDVYTGVARVVNRGSRCGCRGCLNYKVGK